MTLRVVGRKYDGDKLRWSLLPIPAIHACIRVLMHGSKKYDDNNWMYVENWKERYYNAAIRHLTEWWCAVQNWPYFDEKLGQYRKANLVDPDTGESHLAGAMCSIMFLLTLSVMEGQKPNENGPKEEQDTGIDQGAIR